MDNSQNNKKKDQNKPDTKPETPFVPPFPATPTIQQGYTQQGYTLAAIAPSIPHHVWTKENWESFLRLVKEAGDRDQSNNLRYAEMFDNQNKRENKQVWFYSISGVFLLAFGCVLLWNGNSVGTNLILGLLAFASGFLAGRGKRPQQR